MLSFWAVASPQQKEAGAADEPDNAAAAGNAETCFDVTRAQDINVLDDRHVYVRTFGGNQYLLTMDRRCENLERSYRRGGVKIQPYGQRVCPNDGSHFEYEWLGRASVCAIATIDAVESRQDARSLAEADRSRIEVEPAKPAQ